MPVEIKGPSLKRAKILREVGEGGWVSELSLLESPRDGKWRNRNRGARRYHREFQNKCNSSKAPFSQFKIRSFPFWFFTKLIDTNSTYCSSNPVKFILPPFSQLFIIPHIPLRLLEILKQCDTEFVLFCFVLIRALDQDIPCICCGKKKLHRPPMPWHNDDSSSSYHLSQAHHEPGIIWIVLLTLIYLPLATAH